MASTGEEMSEKYKETNLGEAENQTDDWDPNHLAACRPNKAKRISEPLAELNGCRDMISLTHVKFLQSPRAIAIP